MPKRHIPTPSPPSNTDSRAIEEAILYESGELEKAARKNEHDRKEKIKAHIGRASIIIFWILVTSIVLIGFSWLWHSLTPPQWHYLTDDQANKLQTILFSVVLANIAPLFVKKYLT